MVRIEKEVPGEMLAAECFVHGVGQAGGEDQRLGIDHLRRVRQRFYKGGRGAGVERREGKDKNFVSTSFLLNTLSSWTDLFDIYLF